MCILFAVFHEAFKSETSTSSILSGCVCEVGVHRAYGLHFCVTIVMMHKLIRQDQFTVAVMVWVNFISFGEHKSFDLIYVSVRNFIFCRWI
jgi:hypothetical protein